MCGICFLICLNKHHRDDCCCLDADSVRLLRNRGTIHSDVVLIPHSRYAIQAFATVLHLRGSSADGLWRQPAWSDSADSLLLFNGQIFFYGLEPLPADQNDTRWLLNRLDRLDDQNVCTTLALLRGPWALVYYRRGKLWIGRDQLGRRSLCWNHHRMDQSTNLVISSLTVAGRHELVEVPTDMIFCFDLDGGDLHAPRQFIWPRTISGDVPPVAVSGMTMLLPSAGIETPLNDQLPPVHLQSCLLSGQFQIPELVRCEYLRLLQDSVAVRCHRYQQGCCGRCYPNRCRHPTTAVLFSGGLDSTVLALLAQQDDDRPIDLLNVAFDAAAPDRQTAMQAWQELCYLRPKTRWNLVAIDVTGPELAHHRPHIVELIKPKCTVMDVSIGAALWFAARGRGSLARIDTDGRLSWTPGYQTPARIVLTGMGADEQLAGYARHRGAFQRGGWSRLLQELRLDIDRVAERNLGRDDRVIGDHARDARFPFLDQRCVNFLNGLPVWHKCNLNLPRGQGEKLLLREVARDLGLRQTAGYEKRAIQFGSKVVKHQPTAAKGTDSADL